MNYYIIRYWRGFKDCRCLVIADDDTDALARFLEANKGLRSYNIINVSQTTGRIYQLAS